MVTSVIQFSTINEINEICTTSDDIKASTSTYNQSTEASTSNPTNIRSFPNNRWTITICKRLLLHRSSIDLVIPKSIKHCFFNSTTSTLLFGNYSSLYQQSIFNRSILSKVVAQLFSRNYLIKLFIFLFSLFSSFNYVNSIMQNQPPIGCQALHLCCPGRNHTCKSTLKNDIFDNSQYQRGGRHGRSLYSRHSASHPQQKQRQMIKLLEFNANEKFLPVFVHYKNGNKNGIKNRFIGSMILPDLVALNSVGESLAHKFKQTEFFQLVEIETKRKKSHRKRKANHYTDLNSADYFVFGEGELDHRSAIERTIFHAGRPIIRYSILSKYLPLKIGKTMKVMSPTSSSYSSNELNDNRKFQIMYVSEGEEAQCFCDSACVTYDDCCFDYAQFCRKRIPEPCYYSAWSHWSVCRATDASLNTEIGVPETCGGEGIQQRVRSILRGADNPVCHRRHQVVENRACFEECDQRQNLYYNGKISESPSSVEENNRPFTKNMTTTSTVNWIEFNLLSTSTPTTTPTYTKLPYHHHYHYPHSHPHYQHPHFRHRNGRDLVTVALLLDYRYNESRMIRPYYHNQHYYSKLNDNRYSTVLDTPVNDLKTKFQLLPEDDKRFNRDENIFYCVRYELGWVNPKCLEPEWQSTLFSKNIICAECQPDAQLHRNSPRCASDLEDNEKGFWKLIGPTYCYGLWRRIARTDNCTCWRNHPELSQFLMV